MDDTFLYEKIAEWVRQEILAGRLKPGDRLPPIRRMMTRWNCTPGTVQRAYRELAQQGLVISRAGQGTRVAQAPLMPNPLPLRRAALVLRHDYQGTMQQRLEAAGTTVPFVALPTRGTQTLPENFLALCADLAGELAKSFPDRAAAIEHALDSTRTRVGRLAERELARSRPRLHGVPLLVASFQSDFVSWAGAEVVSEFEPAEEASLADLKATVERARANGARGVVGNLQWGDREVRSLGESLGRPVVLLSNFPADTRPGAYARLLRSNLEQLYLLLGDS